MKNIDVKSLLIGVLATALLFACADADKTSPSIVSEAKAAISPKEKWDYKQTWTVERLPWAEFTTGADLGYLIGFEPFEATDKHILWRQPRN